MRVGSTESWLGGLLATIMLVAGCAPPADKSPSSSKSSSGPTSAAQLSVRLLPADNGEVTGVEIVGLTDAERSAFSVLAAAERAAILSICVAGDGANRAGAAELPAVGGESSVEGDCLRFTPRFPLARGMKYRASLDRGRLSSAASASSGPLSFEFSTPAAAVTTATEVARVYPSRDELPENQLKFYIHFSGPMSRGEAYRHIHLLDAEGQELDAVFLELGEELWDPDLRRFTLLCDPGRVKRGLIPREELGSVLQAGKDYTLVVDADWRDAQGKPLAKSLRKKFHVVEPDYSPIDTAAWKIAAPAAGSRDPLVVRFPESLDHSLAVRLLKVEGAGGAPIAGQVDVADQETRWSLTPAEPWRAGEYELIADTALEDLAGNAIGRAFDADTSAAAPQPNDAATVSVPFSVR